MIAGPTLSPFRSSCCPLAVKSLFLAEAVRQQQKAGLPTGKLKGPERPIRRWAEAEEEVVVVCTARSVVETHAGNRRRLLARFRHWCKQAIFHRQEGRHQAPWYGLRSLRQPLHH